MSRSLLHPFLAGLTAAVTFIAVLALGLGFLFMFLPTLPLFWLGLSGKPKDALTAALIAAGLISLVADPAVALFFLVMFGLPAVFIARQSLLNRQGLWFPIGHIMTQLTYGAAGVVALIAFYYFSQGQNLETVLGEQIRAAFTPQNTEYAEAINALAGHFSFLIFSMSIWLWGLALYAHGWLVNRQLTKQKKNVRPDFAINPFLPPDGVLFLLAVCAFATLAASPPLAFLGKALLLGFLLPYFVLGASLMHRMSLSWPSRRFFLFFVYFMTLAAFWPALVLAAIGLVHHIKHLSGWPNSTRS